MPLLLNVATTSTGKNAGKAALKSNEGLLSQVLAGLKKFFKPVQFQNATSEELLQECEFLSK